MTLRDTIHEVFPDLARLDNAPDYRVDATEQDQQLLFEAFMRDSDAATAASIVENSIREWERWQEGTHFS